MPQIGQFTRDASGFTGRIHTFSIFREVTVVPAEPSDAENAPDYRIHHGNEEGPEIGAGWKRTGERAGEYIALIIDDPALPQPIRDDDASNAWSLRWSRPVKRDGKD